MIRAERRAGARDHLAIMAVVAAKAARQEAHYRASRITRSGRSVSLPVTATCPAQFSACGVEGGALNPITDKTGAYGELSVLNQRSALMSSPRRERWQPS